STHDGSCLITQSWPIAHGHHSPRQNCDELSLAVRIRVRVGTQLTCNDGERAASADYPSESAKQFAPRWREQLNLELDAENGSVRLHQCKRRVATSAVDHSANHTGMKKPVLLRQVRTKSQLHLHLTRNDSLKGRAKGLQRGLLCKARAYATLEVRVSGL